MKKQVRRLGIALSAVPLITVLVCASNTNAQDSRTSDSQPEKVSIKTLTQPLDQPKKETESTRVFLKSSLEKYKELHEKIKKNEEEAKAAQQSASTDSAKLELAEKQLQKRLELLGQLTEELSFTTEKMKGVVQSIGGLIGGLKDSASMAEKIAAESKVTEKLISDTETLQREYRALKSKEPAADSDEYWAWYEQVNQKQLAFNEAVNKLDESVQDAIVYERIAQGLNMKKQDIAQWRVFTANLSFLFSSNESKLKSASRRTQQYLEYVQAIGKIGDADEFAKFAAEIGPVMKSIDGLDMPVVGGLDNIKPPVISLPFDIGTTDIRSRVEKLRSELQIKK